VFTDKCKACGHLVARHSFTFRIEDDFQVFYMQIRMFSEMLYRIVTIVSYIIIV